MPPRLVAQQPPQPIEAMRPGLGERLWPVPFMLTDEGELLLTAPTPNEPTTPGDAP